MGRNNILITDASYYFFTKENRKRVFIKLSAKPVLDQIVFVTNDIPGVPESSSPLNCSIEVKLIIQKNNDIDAH